MLVALTERCALLHFRCRCSRGFRERAGVCEPDPIAAVVIGSTVSLVVVIIVAGTYTAWQYRKRLSLKRRSKEQRLRLEALENAWKIEYSQLTFLGDLGSGAFGKVVKADWDGLIVAVKELHAAMREISSASVTDFERESEFLQKTRHPNVVRFFGAGHKPDDGAPFMVLEYVALGSLYDFLRQKSGAGTGRGGGGLDAWLQAYRREHSTVVVIGRADHAPGLHLPSSPPANMGWSTG